MQTEEKKVNGNLVIQILEARLGADKAASFKQTIGRYQQAGNKKLILDLSRVEFIDSSGLGAILSVRKQLGDDGDLVICGATEAVASMFKLTRMDRIFAIHATLEEALAAQTR
jgi:anti-sigma B factor antagonist